MTTAASNRFPRLLCRRLITRRIGFLKGFSSRSNPHRPELARLSARMSASIPTIPTATTSTDSTQRRPRLRRPVLSSETCAPLISPREPGISLASSGTSRGEFPRGFHLPTEIAQIAYWNKRAVYGLLFKAPAETELTIAADPKRMGARVGMTSVLHTWGSALICAPARYLQVRYLLNSHRSVRSVLCL
jgi:hypothetical protein